MKLVVALCVLALAAVAPAQHAQVLRYNNDYGPTNYKWGFQSSDGSSHDQQGELKNQGREDESLVVKGRYSWVGPDGIKYIVTYTADENGYQSELEKEFPGAAYPPAVVATLLGAG